MIYLVRHGEAKPEGPDADRTLTDRGAAGVERVASWAARNGIVVDEIRHSGKRRAEETARILASHLSPRDGVRPVAGIAPDDDPVPVAAELRGGSGRVMLVSHLPFLERLASILVAGDEQRTVVEFRPATLVALRRDDSRLTIATVIHEDPA